MEDPIHVKTTRRIWDNENISESVSEERPAAALDSALEELLRDIQQNLYVTDGLDPEWLDHIDEYLIPSEDGINEEGYIFAYDDKTRAYAGKTWVEVDLSGNVRRKFTAK